jgi:hypothetical protein
VRDQTQVKRCRLAAHQSIADERPLICGETATLKLQVTLDELRR